MDTGAYVPEPSNSIIVRAKPEDRWRIRRPFPPPWEWGLNDDRLHAEFDSAEDAVAAVTALVRWYGGLGQRWATEQATVPDRLARRRVWLDRLSCDWAGTGARVALILVANAIFVGMVMGTADAFGRWGSEAAALIVLGLPALLGFAVGWLARGLGGRS